MNLRKLPTREFDVVLFAAAAALAAYGGLLIYSGSLNTYGEPSLGALGHPVARQALFAIFGLATMAAVSRLDYRLLGPLSFTLYAVSLGALLFVLVSGSSEFGSRRWIDVAGTRVQPSEIAKVCTVIMLAKFFADNESRVETLRVFVLSLLIAGAPAALVLVQPDMGSALVFMIIWLGMVLIAGARASHVAGLAAVAAAISPFAFTQLVHGYQLDRFRVWFDPHEDPTGAGFNVLQAEISVGSGRVLGKGLTHGTQTQLDYLRTQTTDYIFSVGAEELGFIGAMLLFALFTVLLLRCVRVASLADDTFGRLIAVGVVSYIIFQAFVNIGVNIRLVPVTGVPLPLVSQGGSSLVTIMLALGVVQSILGYRRKRGRTA